MRCSARLPYPSYPTGAIWSTGPFPDVGIPGKRESRKPQRRQCLPQNLRENSRGKRPGGTDCVIAHSAAQNKVMEPYFVSAGTIFNVSIEVLWQGVNSG